MARWRSERGGEAMELWRQAICEATILNELVAKGSAGGGERAGAGFSERSSRQRKTKPSVGPTQRGMSKSLASPKHRALHVTAHKKAG